MPAAASAINMMDRNKHTYDKSSSKSKEQETCIICMEEFKDDDEVVELGCDERHIFHFECISKYMAV